MLVGIEGLLELKVLRQWERRAVEGIVTFWRLGQAEKKVQWQVLQKTGQDFKRKAGRVLNSFRNNPSRLIQSKRS